VSRSETAMRLVRSVAPGLVALLAGCAGMYFDDAGEPPGPPPTHALPELPFDEHWSGLVFNGNKIGFSHLAVAPAADEADLYAIRSRSSMRLRFLGIDKRVALFAEDWVRPDLTLARFRGDYRIDDSRLVVQGRVSDGLLEVRVETRGEVHRETLAIDGELYPSSVINLVPVARGLEVGTSRRFRIYDAQTQSIATVTQEILGYESSELFEGNAFKIRTRLHGQQVTTWIDAEGRPLLEMSLGGVLIAGLESERAAKRYLAQAALEKREALLEFSLVPSEPSIRRPRDVSSLQLVLEGVDDIDVPSDGWQRCSQRGGDASCRIAARAPLSSVQSNADVGAYLRGSVTVPSSHTGIRRLAADITADAAGDAERIDALVRWIDENVDRKAVDVFSALDVLETRAAECQGITYLYSAFARSLGIPTRVVNGIVYASEQGDGFLYHTWAESRLDGRWTAVDPTFGQPRADATHVKLVEGETLAEMAPIVNVMGRLKARVVEVEY